MFVLDTPLLLLSTHRSSFISFRKENGRLINILHPVGFYSTVFEKKSANLICIEFWIAYLLDNYLPLSRSSSIIHWGQEPAYDLF